jgi:hypothetical protein
LKHISVQNFVGVSKFENNMSKLEKSASSNYNSVFSQHANLTQKSSHLLVMTMENQSKLDMAVSVQMLHDDVKHTTAIRDVALPFVLKSLESLNLCVPFDNHDLSFGTHDELLIHTLCSHPTLLSSVLMRCSQSWLNRIQTLSGLINSRMTSAADRAELTALQVRLKIQRKISEHISQTLDRCKQLFFRQIKVSWQSQSGQEGFLSFHECPSLLRNSFLIDLFSLSKLFRDHVQFFFQSDQSTSSDELTRASNCSAPCQLNSLSQTIKVGTFQSISICVTCSPHVDIPLHLILYIFPYLEEEKDFFENNDTNAQMLDSCERQYYCSNHTLRSSSTDNYDDWNVYNQQIMLANSPNHRGKSDVVYHSSNVSHSNLAPKISFTAGDHQAPRNDTLNREARFSHCERKVCQYMLITGSQVQALPQLKPGESYIKQLKVCFLKPGKYFLKCAVRHRPLNCKSQENISRFERRRPMDVNQDECTRTGSISAVNATPDPMMRGFANFYQTRIISSTPLMINAVLPELNSYVRSNDIIAV